MDIPYLNSFEILNSIFDKLESECSFHKFNSEEVIIFTDFSGEHKAPNYSYSFYLISKYSADLAIEEILELRNNEPSLSEKSFFEFKKLKKDKVRQRLLPRFLQIFDNYEGLSFTFLKDKDSPDFLIKLPNSANALLNDNGFQSWNSNVLQKQNDVLILLTFLVKRFLNEENNLIWYSDKDDIFGAGMSKKNDTLNIFSKYLGLFNAKLKSNTFAFISDKDTPLNSDFMSIPDLIAGAAQEFYIHKKDPSQIKELHQPILDWLNIKSNLNKVVLAGFQHDNDKHIERLKNF